MRESSNEQFKEIKEACLSSYQQGYWEGFEDGCKQLSKAIFGFVDASTKSLIEAVKETRDEEKKED